jgi:hypothetical protein
MNSKAEDLLAAPETSDWLRLALLAALRRDPVDAANDARTLALVLSDRAQAHMAVVMALPGLRPPS